MKNVYDLALWLRDLDADGHDVSPKAFELVDAVLREKDCRYIPVGWTKTGVYGVCSKCTDYVRGCGIFSKETANDTNIICPDCHQEASDGNVGP